MISTLFFDLDGVLTTQNNGSHTTATYISDKTGIPFEKVLNSYRTFYKEVSFGQRTAEEFWTLFCKDIAQELPFSLLDEAFQSTPKNEEMFSLCKKLKNNYTLGIITDNGKRRMDILNTLWGLDNLFDTIATSYQVGSFKDDDKIFQLALKNLDVSAEEALFIDNGEKNLVVPAQMGFQTYYFDETKNDILALENQLRSYDILI